LALYVSRDENNNLKKRCLTTLFHCFFGLYARRLNQHFFIHFFTPPQRRRHDGLLYLNCGAAATKIFAGGGLAAALAVSWAERIGGRESEAVARRNL